MLKKGWGSFAKSMEPVNFDQNWKQKTCKRSRIESSKTCQGVIDKNISICESSSVVNEQHSGTYIDQNDRGYWQRLSDHKWNHDYLLGIWPTSSLGW